jgi:hypothetical protein
LRAVFGAATSLSREIGEEQMRNDKGLTEASRQYAAAHAAHYETKDLREGLELYRGILAAHPDTQEAGYSRSQIQNIIKEVVPERELLEAQVGMAMAHFGGDRQQERRIPVTPTAEARA